jgi:Co/Zn/Cd efflux system component/ribosomal protein S19E (S16A)
MNRRFFKASQKEEMHRFVLLVLLNEALTKEHMVQKYYSYLTHYGLRSARIGEATPDPELLESVLLRLSKESLVEKNGEAYCLTAKGKAQALKAKKSVTRFHEYLSSGTAASKVSVLTNTFLAGTKLFAGLLSNSIGLISDGLDNSIDVFSSGSVYFGTKHKKEFFANLLILAVLFAGGVTLGYNGITRLIKPEPVEAGLLPALVAVAAAILCYEMSIYQRFVGKKTGNLSLFSQSVDSANHVLIAVAVLVGIAFAAVGLPIVDSLVSLGVATLIIKSGIELSIETAKTAKGEKTDFSRFKARWEKQLANFRHDYFKFWILIKTEKPISFEELCLESDRTFQTENSAYLKDFGPNVSEEFDFKESGKALLHELVGQGWIMKKDGKFQIAETGREKLKERLKRARRRF